MKKKFSIFLSVSFIALLLSNVAYATTHYYLNQYVNIEAYEYGADWTSSLSAIVNSNGYFTDITGIKERVQIYRNGIKIVDTSGYDTTSPYSVSLDGSETSSARSNAWQNTTLSYHKTGSATSYTYDCSVTRYASN